MSEGRTYLDVSFAEKDDARQLGARWDPARKQWYVPPSVSLTAFARWLRAGSVERSAVESGPFMIAPIVLLRGSSTCWKCQKWADVFCLACSDVDEGPEAATLGPPNDELLLISDLGSVAPSLERQLARLAHTYRLDWSQTQGQRLWMNHCGACGAKMGDFFLHEEPSGAFFIDSARKWNRIRQVILEREGRFPFSGSVGL